MQQMQHPIETALAQPPVDGLSPVHLVDDDQDDSAPATAFRAASATTAPSTSVSGSHSIRVGTGSRHDGTTARELFTTGRPSTANAAVTQGYPAGSGTG
ncbi:hypothetical protein ACFQ3Z_45975 [Streptomyces nogalater]